MGSNMKLHKRYFKDREVSICLQPYGSYLPYYNRTLNLFITLFLKEYWVITPTHMLTPRPCRKVWSQSRWTSCL